MQPLDWWKSAVIYEIYPRSFQDSNGDGIGDLPGITQRLDYLVQLGIDAIWIAPMYRSPMADFGYDVAGYCSVDPMFGTMQDFDHLLQQAHSHGLKVVLDFVPNHTSDQHPWFLESKASRENPKRDWYLWRDQPNNWMSNFGGLGWQWNEATGDYYYHSFLKEQPDLNWRNPEVRAAMYDALRFWLEKGVDGFRVDVMWMMIKDDQYRDNPPNPAYRAGDPSNNSLLPVYNTDRPEVHEVVQEMRAVVDSFHDRLLIGEIYLPVAELMTYYGADLKGAVPFNFLLLQSAWNPQAIATVLTEYMDALPQGACPNWVLGNHDRPRLASRVGTASAPLAAMLLLTLPGTITMYYGEEIGMIDGVIAPAAIQDPAEKRQPGLGLGRDPERTPMPWDASALAGFTTGQPWLPLNADHAFVNVEVLQGQADSLLHLYRELMSLRQMHAAIAGSEIVAVIAQQQVLRYERMRGGERVLVLLNFGAVAVEVECLPGTVLLSTRLERAGESVSRRVLLGGYEGLIVEVEGVVVT